MSTGGWSGPSGPWRPQQGPPYPGPPHPPGPYGPTPGQQHDHPWGPPTGAGAPAPEQPRRGRGRRALLLILAGLVVVELVVLALLAFVVGPRFARIDVLDPVAVERGVSDVVTRDWRRTVTAVDCPSEVRARAGESFRCSATVDGRPRQVPVDVLDDEGTYQVGQPR